jgi:hypothetical protein
MAHYAFIDENNIVVDIIYGRDEDDLVDGIDSWETYYGSHRNMRCLRTSINMIGGVHLDGKEPFRYNYAIIGGYYDEEKDGFVSPQPPLQSSWVVNPDTLVWEPPIPHPGDGLYYRWDEEMQMWDRLPNSPTTPRPDDEQDWVWDDTNQQWVIDSDPLP